MSHAFVLGNGISRNPIAVDKLLEIGPVYGCNALYRTHTPTVLVSTDTPISEAIQNSGYSLHNRFYTRRPIPGLGANTVPQVYRGYSSGPIAISLAAADYCSPVYLLGFDLGPNTAGRFNNVYASTEFYKTADAGPTFTGNWVRQIMAVARDYPKTQFVRVMGPTTAEIAEFAAVENMQSLSFADFVALINTIPKDL
jgi:hypothetical protein